MSVTRKRCSPLFKSINLLQCTGDCKGKHMVVVILKLNNTVYREIKYKEYLVYQM